VGAVAEILAAGDHPAAARQFVETVAFGPGAWDSMSSQARETFIFNAPTWLDEVRDPSAPSMDLKTLRGFSAPTLLTMGDQSLPFFAPVVQRIAREMPEALTHTYRGAAHVPHLSHPEEFVGVVTEFIHHRRVRAPEQA
jgi:pimeloyl-ACP methyl ester carboxylesterase